MREKIDQFAEKYLYKSDFIRNVIVLMSGTAIAQAVPFLISPLLTRIYSPTDFGYFGLYTSIVSILVVIAALRFDLAIMLPKKHIDAFKIYFLATLITTIYTFIISVFVVGYYFLSPGDNWQNWLLLIPISVFILGNYQNLNYWNNRLKKFKVISKAKVIRSFSSAIIQLCLGYYFQSYIWLIIGVLAGQLIEVIILFYYNKSFLRLSKILNIKKLKATFRENIGFIKVDSFSALLNSSSIYLPILLLPKLYSEEEAGLYFQAFKILSLPAALVGAAFSQVFFQKVSSLKGSPIEMAETVKNTIKKLFYLSILPAIIIIVFGPDLFSFVFGSQWYVSGKYAQAIVPWVLSNFIFAPISFVYTVQKRFKEFLLFNITLLLIRSLVFVLGPSYELSSIAILTYYSLFSSVMYLFMVRRAYVISKTSHL